MERRDFFKYAGLGGALVVASPFSACQPQEKKSTVGGTEVGGDNFVLNEKTIDQLQAVMENGEMTAREITQLYLNRIKEIDQDGPALHAILETNPDALEIADQLDRERAEGKVRGPMHGIPVVIKANIDTGDQMTTTAGASVLEGSVAPADAFLVERLRRSGAIILGKANLSEWANFRSTRSSSGWSGLGGQVRNPYILDRSPCGSSSGSGVAVSANLCAAAVGTETNGSIVCPSSTNGVVGIKPTVGLISRRGVIPISFSQDTAGPMTRTVKDAAILLGAMVGVDKADAKSADSEPFSQSDYTQYLDKDGLQGARIGVARRFFGFHEGVDALMEAALEDLKRYGAELIELEDFAMDRSLYGPSYQVLLYEFKDGLNKYLASLGENAPVKNLEEVIAWNKAHPDQAMPFFKQEILEQAQEKGDLSSAEYLEAREKVQKAAGKEGIDRAVSDHNLDAIVAPSGSPAWVIDLVAGDNHLGGSSSPAAWAGYPNISVPAGYIYGLPVGISFFGPAWTEGKLLALAYSYEQGTQHRLPPQFLPTLPLNKSS